MSTLKRSIRVALQASLATGAIALAACHQQPQNPTAAAASTAPAPASTAPAAPPYTPPTADQLYQLVAPIALFPDKLVALVLAGATHPDQITAADSMLRQNPGLNGQALLTQVDAQPWDPGVKGLTTFPKVLDQMASNIQWTTALGQAYANDPTDVMNAIQAMRQRAQAHGTLKTTQQQVVTTQTVTSVEPASYYGGESDIVPPPRQVIQIAPAQEGVVYVPQYNPEVVYGEPVGYYPGYTYVQPTYVEHDYGSEITAGLIGFGAGIVIASLFEHHHYHWGWNSWGMRWHGGPPPPPPPGGWGPGGPGPGAWRGPAVVHNDTVYAPHNTYINNVVNRTTVINNDQRNFTNNGSINRYAAGAAAVGAGAEAAALLARQQTLRNQAMQEAARMAGGRQGMPMAHANVPNTLRPGPVMRVAEPGRPMSMPNFAHTEAARYANPQAATFRPAMPVAHAAGNAPEREAMRMRQARSAAMPQPEDHVERRLPREPQFHPAGTREMPQQREQAPRQMQMPRMREREQEPAPMREAPRQMPSMRQQAPRQFAPHAEPRPAERHDAPRPQEHRRDDKHDHR